MSENLSDRLERFEFSDELRNGDFTLIQEAAAFVRAVEDAPSAMVRSATACRAFVPFTALPKSYAGKRVKLVKVKR